MHKRLVQFLVAGGTLACCSVPQFLFAENGTPQWQNGPDGRIAIFVGGTQEPAPVKASAPPASARMAVPPVSENDSGASPYRLLIESISSRNGVDPDLIDAMMKTESNYNPKAISSKGARGLMQLIPETGRRFGVEDFFDPRQNIEGGVRYIKYLLEMFHGNVDLSLAAYNAGENLVARLGKIPPISETRNYVQKIRTAYTKPATPILPTGMVGSTKPVLSARLPEAERVADNAKDSPSPPVANWTDDRGVRHFSNLDPVR